MRHLLFILSIFALVPLRAHESLRMEFDQAAFEFLQKMELFDFPQWQSVSFTVENSHHSEEQKCKSLKAEEILP